MSDDSAEPAPPRTRTPRAPAAPAAGWRTPEGLALALAGVGLPFAGHILYGALVSDVAMVMDFAAALLLIVLLAQRSFRRDLLGLKGLMPLALCMAAVLAVAGWTLTPYTPGGPHPVWSYVGAGAPAAAMDKSGVIVEMVKLLGLSCIFLVGAITATSDARARTALNLTIVGGALFGLWAFFGHVTGILYHTQPGRLEANFLNPNTAGVFFAALLTLCVGMLVRRIRAAPERERLTTALPLVAAALIFAGCLIATASRAAAVAALVALAAFIAAHVFTGRWKFGRAVVIGFAGLALAAVLMAAAGDMLITRYFGTGEAAIARAYVWRVHWEAFLASPLFGYGLGGFETVNKTLISTANFNELWNIRSALNVYLQWLEQAGLVGAAPMFLCIAIILGVVLFGAFRRSRMTSPLFALLAVDLLVLIQGASDFALETPSFSAFWAYLLGLQFALAQGSSAR